MKKRILTGIKPTSYQLHIGNYFGAVKPLFSLVEKNPNADVFFMLATMHALTTLHDGTVLGDNVLSCAKMYLAMLRGYGLQDDSLVIFNQPDVSGHAQLTWVLQCITHMGFLERMHAYKDAVSKGRGSEVSVGTFCYPVLQAVDVILYDTNFVPVGKDQKQHIEYARDMAAKFNNMYGETFVLPKVIIQKAVATVPGIDGRKMSKSYNNYIGLLDDDALILKKIKKIPTAAVTIEEPKNPDECNVYNILKLFLTEDEDSSIRDRYTSGGLSFKEVKDYLYEKVIDFVSPIKKNFYSIDDEFVLDMLARNAIIANEIANSKVSEVYGKVGLSL